jgi:hypothetical protein
VPAFSLSSADANSRDRADRPAGAGHADTDGDVDRCAYPHAGAGGACPHRDTCARDADPAVDGHADERAHGHADRDAAADRHARTGTRGADGHGDPCPLCDPDSYVFPGRRHALARGIL